MCIRDRDIPAIDYVIQGDREYCRLQQELNEANERNDGHAIARIHGQLETLDAVSYTHL